MKPVVGLVLSVLLGLLVNWVSGFFVKKAQRRKRLVLAALVVVMTLSAAMLFVPDSPGLSSSGQPPEVIIAASQKMGESAALPRRAVCRVSLELENASAQPIVLEETKPTVYLGDKLLQADATGLRGGDGITNYVALYWTGGQRTSIGDVIRDARLDTAFHSIQPASLVVKPGMSARMAADIIVDTATSSWLFRGRKYPVSDYQEPKLPHSNHVAVRFDFKGRGWTGTQTPFASCTVIEQASDPGDFGGTQPRFVTGEG